MFFVFFTSNTCNYSNTYRESITHFKNKTKIVVAMDKTKIIFEKYWGYLALVAWVGLAVSLELVRTSPLVWMKKPLEAYFLHGQ